MLLYDVAAVSRMSYTTGDQEMNRSAFAVALLAGALFLPAPAQAALHFFSATLSGAEEVPPHDTPATGFGTVVLDDVALTITVDLSFADLTTPSVAAHIHEAPFGVNGPIEFPLDLGAALGQTSGTILTQVFPLLEGQEDVEEFLNAGYYFNVHSEQFPGGEIRGQVLQQVNGVPEPGTLLLMTIGGLGMLGASLRRRRDDQ
jgi:PEP-CTERM putative exosortase interaction domain